VSVTETVQLNPVSFVSVSEAMSVTDAPTVAFGTAADLTVSVSDAIGVAEATTLLETSFVTVSDSVSLTDSPSLTETSFVAVSDSMTVAENAPTRLQGHVVVSDSITVSESTTEALISLVSVVDSSTVTDTPAVQVPLLGPVTISDSVNVAESASAALVAIGSLAITVSDSIGVSEAVSLLETSLLSVSESVTVSESLTLLLVSAVAVSDSITVSETPPTSLADPVAYWSFNENTGTSVADSTGNHSGTWQGTFDTPWEAGKIGSAGKFNGDSYVAVPNDSALDILGPVSISAWIYRTADQWGSIITKNDSANYAGSDRNVPYRFLITDSGALFFTRADGAGQYYAFTDPLTSTTPGTISSSRMTAAR